MFPVMENSFTAPFPALTAGTPWPFFEALGVPLKTERGSRVFPVSDRSFDISGALERRLRKLRVAIVRDRAAALEIKDGAVAGVTGERGSYPAQAVILATGGVSYPATGSTGDGHRLAAAAGHTVTELRGSLVPLLAPDCASLQGLSLRNVGLTVFENGKKIYTDFGEMLFTHFGVSGPMVLSGSAHMRHFDKKTYRLEIDLKPALDEPTLDKRLVADFTKYANHDFCNALNDLLPQKLIPVFVERSGVDPHPEGPRPDPAGAAGRAGAAQGLDRGHPGALPGGAGHRHLRRREGGGDRPQDHGIKDCKGIILCGRADRCGCLHRRLQLTDRLGYGPGGRPRRGGRPMRGESRRYDGNHQRGH